MKICDPELTTDGCALRRGADRAHEQFGVRARGELAGGGLPESGILQLVALVINCLVVHVLNGEMRAAGAVEFASLVVACEIVSGIRLHRNVLKESGVIHSWTVECDQQETPSTVKLAGTGGYCNAGLLLCSQ